MLRRPEAGKSLEKRGGRCQGPLEQGEEVGAFVSGSVRMSRMNVSGPLSQWGEEVGAAVVESAGMLGIVSASRLSCICNLTVIK